MIDTANKTSIPSITDLFPSSTKEGKCDNFNVGDMVTWSGLSPGMSARYGDGPFRVLAIIEKFTARDEHGYRYAPKAFVVVGKCINEHWMVYNSKAEQYKIPSNPNDHEWHFWSNGPTTFDPGHFKKI